MNLGEHFLAGKVFLEHHEYYERDYKIEESYFTDNGFDTKLPLPIHFKGNNKYFCFAINANRTITNSYYIGVDWLTERKAVFVQPKLNKGRQEQVNYLEMLFDALKHPDVFEHTSDLFEIKWEKPVIQINQQQDMLTPLLVIQYLQLVKNLVRKGLKKSYYKVELNLPSRVKGKVLVAQNIKQNQAKARVLNTFCSFDEFGFNGIENRILKKALVFVERYLPTFKDIGNTTQLTQTYNYIRPAFEQVSAEANMRECQHINVNPFYKEYKLAIDLAKQLLKRFGYNIQNASVTQVTTPPFWIDMSRLFELYVLGLLKDSYKNVGTIDFQYSTTGNKLDFLISAGGHRMVIDAKYKPRYSESSLDDKQHQDIRQVSGYARLKQVYSKLEKVPKIGNPYELIDCMIIYPERDLKTDDKSYKLELTKDNPVGDYVGVYKCPVKLPLVSTIS